MKFNWTFCRHFKDVFLGKIKDLKLKKIFKNMAAQYPSSLNIVPLLSAQLENNSRTFKDLAVLIFEDFKVWILFYKADFHYRPASH